MKLTEFFRKAQFPAMIALGTGCAAVSLCAYFAPGLLTAVWLLPAVYLLVATGGLLFPAKARVWLAGIGAVIFFVATCRGQTGMDLALAFGLSAVYSGVLLWSMGIGGWEREREISGAWLGACMLVLLACLFFSVAEPKLLFLQPWVKLCVFAFTLLAMLSLNRGSRSLASGGKQNYSAAMRLKNTMLTLGMFGIALAVALIPSLIGLVKAVVSAIAKLIAMLAALFPEETEPTETTVATEPLGELDFKDVIEVPPGRGLSEQEAMIMWAVAAAVAIMLVLLASHKLLRGVKNIFSRIYETVTGDIMTEAADFRDEITDTRNEGDGVYTTEKGKSRKKPVPRRKMTPVQRIRYRYQRLAQKHPEWGLQSTARENLHDTAAKLYEQARYSNHPISESDAAAFEQETQRK